MGLLQAWQNEWTMSEMLKYKDSVLLKRPKSGPVCHHLWHSSWHALQMTKNYPISMLTPFMLVKYLVKKTEIWFDFEEIKKWSDQENSRFWTKVGIKSEVHCVANGLENAKTLKLKCPFFGWITLWPEWHFGQSDPLASDTLAGETFWPVTLWLVTLWPEWYFGQSDTLASFFCFLWGTKGWIKIPCGGPLGKIWKK